MGEKRKPYATITFRKPRLPFLATVGLILFVVMVSGLLGWRDFEGMQAKLQETEALLQDRTISLNDTASRLQTVESQLQETTTKLEDYSRFWRELDEPLGYRIWHEPEIGLEAITCVLVPEDFRLSASVYDNGYLFHYELRGRDAISAIIGNDRYKLVGKDKWGANWTYDDDLSEDYYMHDNVHRVFPFKWWSSTKDWLENSWDWEDRLQRYCKNSVNA